MKPMSDEFRERLLAQQTTAPEKLALYRKEVQAMLERNEQVLRRQKWYVRVLWLFLVATVTALLVAGGFRSTSPLGTFSAILACVWLLFGAVELLKYFINRSRVELLKEIKRVEMNVLELRELLHGRGAD